MLFCCPNCFFIMLSCPAVNELVGNFFPIPCHLMTPVYLCFIVSFISFSSVSWKIQLSAIFFNHWPKKSVHLSKISIYHRRSSHVCPDDDPNAAVLVRAAPFSCLRNTSSTRTCNSRSFLLSFQSRLACADCWRYSCSNWLSSFFQTSTGGSPSGSASLSLRLAK